MSIIYLNLYINENSENIFKEKIEINIKDKICELREKILNKYFDNNIYNYVNLTNITSRVYKDYGMLFFDKGLLPDIVNNYTIDKFTTEDRTFDFLIEPCKKIINKIKITNRVSAKKSFYDPNRRFNNDYVEEKQEGFVFREEDFPPLS